METTYPCVAFTWCVNGLNYRLGKQWVHLPGDRPYRSVVDHCWTAWADFKEFTRNAAHGAIVHALTQLRSHYPLVDLQWVATEYAQGTNMEKIARLEDDEEEPAKRLAKDVELFGEGESSAL